jgi:chorismate mutase
MQTPMSITISADEKKLINELLKQIVQAKLDQDTAKHDIAECKKQIREILDVETKVLNQVINIRYKQNRDEYTDYMTQVDAVLDSLI